MNSLGEGCIEKKISYASYLIRVLYNNVRVMLDDVVCFRYRYRLLSVCSFFSLLVLACGSDNMAASPADDGSAGTDRLDASQLSRDGDEMVRDSKVVAVDVGGSNEHQDGSVQATSDAKGDSDQLAPVKYKLSLDPNGGTSSYDSIEVAEGEAASKPADPFRPGYGLTGWYTSATSQTEATRFRFKYESEATVVTSNMVLYGGWAPARYTLSYDANGGTLSGPKTVIVDRGATASKPSQPKRPGFVFTGWYILASSENQNRAARFKFVGDEGGGSPITADLPLYAGWRRLGIQDLAEASATQVPDDLTNYDDVTRAAFGSYNKGTELYFMYVTENGGTDVSKRDGKSWATAWSGAQLKTALSGIKDAGIRKGTAGVDKICVVLVAGGIYRIGSSLVLKNYIPIIGGWDGTGGGGGWAENPGDPVSETEFKGSGSEAKKYSVVSGVSLNDKAALTRVTISDGYAGDGGGMSNTGTGLTAPRFTYITFKDNRANRGGAVFNQNASLVMTNVVFKNNKAVQYGGAMYNFRSWPRLTQVTFDGNAVEGEDNEKNSGGGMYNLYSIAMLDQVTFSENSAYIGGGMSSSSSWSLLVNTTFRNNLAARAGAGMYLNTNDRFAMILNSIFWGNNVKGNTFGAQIYVNNDKNPGVGVVQKEYLVLFHDIIQGGIGDTDVEFGAGTLEQRQVSGGILLSEKEKGDPVAIDYVNVYDADPLLSSLRKNGGYVPTAALASSSPALNKGVYVNWSGSLLEVDLATEIPTDREGVQKFKFGMAFFYSDKSSVWYKIVHPILGQPKDPIKLPSNVESLSTKDARSYSRQGLPDLGAYEYGGVAPAR